MEATNTTTIIDALGLTTTAEFVPLSKSKNRYENHASLNYTVTVYCNRRPILTTPYMMGVAHCESYAGRVTSAVVSECEGGTTVKPAAEDVLQCLVSDASAIDYADYESWADEYGYDRDSRKGENVYRDCLDTALRLRAAIGESGIAKLREYFQDK